jgi:hypothetical protein
MIVRVMVVDPTPRPHSENDVVLYQVPENSRAYELLVSMLTERKLDFCTLKPGEK